MGPRLFSRGKPTMNCRHCRQRKGFNGAATVQPRKAGLSAWRIERSPRFNGAATVQPRKEGQHWHEAAGRNRASMGPRLFSRGKQSRRRSGIPTPRRLQWGRDCSAAERCPSVADTPSDIPGFNGAATVQPRKGASEAEHDHGDQASMGPRLFSRGKNRVLKISCGVMDALQWGRDCSAAESPWRITWWRWK